MFFDYWYDDGYDYGYSDISVDGYSGLFGGLLDGIGSLFGGLFSDDYYYSDYGYGYDWEDDEVISVGSSDDLDDYSLLDSVFGLFDGSLSTDGSSGLLGLLDGVESVLGGLFSDDYYYSGYGYDYDYGYDYGYGWDDDEVISVGSSDDLSAISGLDSILELLGGSDSSLLADGSEHRHSEADARHEHSVHHIKMQRLRAAVTNTPDLFSQAVEVRRQD